MCPYDSPQPTPAPRFCQAVFHARGNPTESHEETRAVDGACARREVGDEQRVGIGAKGPSGFDRRAEGGGRRRECSQPVAQKEPGFPEEA